MLGVNPMLGRGFVIEDEKPGTHVAVLSYALVAVHLRRRQEHRRPQHHARQQQLYRHRSYAAGFPVPHDPPGAGALDFAGR